MMIVIREWCVNGGLIALASVVAALSAFGLFRWAIRQGISKCRLAGFWVMMSGICIATYVGGTKGPGAPPASGLLSCSSPLMDLDEREETVGRPLRLQIDSFTCPSNGLVSLGLTWPDGHFIGLLGPSVDIFAANTLMGNAPLKNSGI